MVCSSCGGCCRWVGPLVALTHVECEDCGAINSQEPEDEVDDAESEIDGGR